MQPWRDHLVSIQSRRWSAARLWAAASAAGLVLATVSVATSSAGATGSNTLGVKASEYQFKVSGTPKAGWVEIGFDNTGVEDHMMATVQLKPGVTLKQLKKAASSDGDAAFQKIAAPDATENGPSGMPDILGPKQETATITQLPAGHYGLLCFVPTADGTPHFMKGMTDTFDVKKGKSSLKPPTDGVTDVTLSDSAITFPSENVGRSVTLKVTNTGTAEHGFTFVKVDDGKTLDDVKSYFDALFSGQSPSGDAPGAIVGGISGVDPGKTAYLEQRLEPGHYGYVSTQGDDPSTDDYAKGLKGEFDVK
jgi:hypothetical protein